MEILSSLDLAVALRVWSGGEHGTEVLSSQGFPTRVTSNLEKVTPVGGQSGPDAPGSVVEQCRLDFRDPSPSGAEYPCAVYNLHS